MAALRAYREVFNALRDPRRGTAVLEATCGGRRSATAVNGSVPRRLGTQRSELMNVLPQHLRRDQHRPSIRYLEALTILDHIHARLEAIGKVAELVHDAAA